MGFPDSGNAVPLVAASFLIPLVNQNLALQDACASSAAFVEMELIHCLRKLLGYQPPEKYFFLRDTGGVIILGGCLSNIVTLMAAREYTFLGSGLVGLPVLAKHVRVLVPESYRTSFHALGSGMSLAWARSMLYGFQLTKPLEYVWTSLTSVLITRELVGDT